MRRAAPLLLLLSACSVTSSTAYPDNLTCVRGHDEWNPATEAEPEFICDEYAPRSPGGTP